jgi:hypothetical protein
VQKKMAENVWKTPWETDEIDEMLLQCLKKTEMVNEAQSFLTDSPFGRTIQL